MKIPVVLALVLLASPVCAASFVISAPSDRCIFRSMSHFQMASSGKGKKGFGKQQPKQTTRKTPTPSTTSPTTNNDKDDSSRISPMPLESIGTALTTESSVSRPPSGNIEVDPNASAEERTSQILRDKYGLRSYEEKQTDRKRRESQERLRELKKKADAGKDIDLFSLIPPPVLILIDRFLKLGLAVSVFLFVAAGIAVAVEAWSHATGGALPQDVDDFITNVVEPNFTPGLLVLLGFSISLGLFASAQLGSESSQYSEK